uniref:Glycosyltransferase n=1 Tax=viral metagenome TaxID=1070528 RepID=A0A6C0AJD7_9ZZZZ
MLTVRKCAGLGNQLFMLASVEGFAERSARVFYVNITDIFDTNPHSRNTYYDTILKNWASLHQNLVEDIALGDNKFMRPMDWPHILRSRPEQNIKLCGYFQRWEYVHPIRDRFVQRLSFNESVLKKYPEISNCIFVHVRGGDYIGSSLHHVDLNNYYKKCLDIVHPQTLILFTNDIPYAMNIMESRSFIIADENEEDSLFLMSKCRGGIIGNSTFAWWGAYLNPNRQIFMPSKWFLDPEFDSTGYFFPGATVVEV